MLTTRIAPAQLTEVPCSPTLWPNGQLPAADDVLARVPLSPAPWQLVGRGIIVLFRPDERFAGVLPRAQQDRYRGGVPVLMAVRYLSSDVGPYDELLFVPGRVDFDGEALYTISHIAVSTLASVVNGWLNWAIPKELAGLRFDNHGRRYSLRGERADGFSAEIVAEGGGLPLPLTTAIMPHTLGQERDGRLYVTRLKARGWALRARLDRLDLAGPFLPALDWATVCMTVTVDRVHMHFPVAEVRERENSL
jgi:hypothetical protein